MSEYPDLSAARAAVTALCIDDFAVDRDTEGSGDDTFDYDTGVLTPPAGDASRVYEGKGKMSPAGTQGAPYTTGDQTSEETDYIFTVPITADYEPKIGDLVTCTGSVRDQLMVGKQWIVSNPKHGTFSVSIKAMCELRLTPDGPQ